MLSIPRPITGITHPFIKDIYLKKSRGRNRKREDVLVIEALSDEADNTTEHDGFDSYLACLLMDLHDLEQQVEKKVGHVDRIDIRHH